MTLAMCRVGVGMNDDKYVPSVRRTIERIGEDEGVGIGNRLFFR